MDSTDSETHWVAPTIRPASSRERIVSAVRDAGNGHSAEPRPGPRPTPSADRNASDPLHMSTSDTAAGESASPPHDGPLARPLEHEAEHRPSIIAPGHQRRQPASAAPSGEPVPAPRPRPWRQSSSSIGRGEEASTLDAGRQQRIDHGAALAADPLAPITRKAAIVRAGSTADLTLRQGFLVGPVGPTLVVVVFASPTVQRVSRPNRSWHPPSRPGSSGGQPCRPPG